MQDLTYSLPQHIKSVVKGPRPLKYNALYYVIDNPPTKRLKYKFKIACFEKGIIRIATFNFA